MLLNPVLGKLVSKRVVLASASPRRQEILTNVVSARGPLASPRPGRARCRHRRRGGERGCAGAGRGKRPFNGCPATAWCWACRVRRLPALPLVSSRGLVAQGGQQPEPCVLQQPVL